MYIEKQEDKLPAFITYCNAQLSKWKTDLKFNLITKSGKFFFEFENTKVDYKVQLDQQYASAIGFSTHLFTNGKFVAEESFSQPKFDAIDQTTKFGIIQFKDTEIEVAVQEPPVKTLTELINKMNNALLTYEVEFRWDGQTFEYESNARIHTIIKLSSYLNHLFYISDGKEFQLKHESLPTVGTIKFSGPSEFFIVKCHIVQSQFVYGHSQFLCYELST